jgi:hypothetical protein
MNLEHVCLELTCKMKGAADGVIPWRYKQSFPYFPEVVLTLLVEVRASEIVRIPNGTRRTFDYFLLTDS